MLVNTYHIHNNLRSPGRLVLLIFMLWCFFDYLNFVRRQVKSLSLYARYFTDCCMNLHFAFCKRNLISIIDQTLSLKLPGVWNHLFLLSTHHPNT